VGRKKSFRDEEHYIHYEQPEAKTEKGYSLAKDGSFMEQAQKAQVDFTGDDAETIRKQKNSLVWDRKRKRFVHGVAPKEPGKTKTESGKSLKKSYKTNAFPSFLYFAPLPPPLIHLPLSFLCL